MTETIIAALISGGTALIVTLITSAFQMKKTETIILYRLQELEKKQERHNGLIDRVTTVEIYDRETRKDVDELFKRVREMERAERSTK